jgi:hypothetical protein
VPPTAVFALVPAAPALPPVVGIAPLPPPPVPTVPPAARPPAGTPVVEVPAVTEARPEVPPKAELLPPLVPRGVSLAVDPVHAKETETAKPAKVTRAILRRFMDSSFRAKGPSGNAGKSRDRSGILFTVRKRRVSLGIFQASSAIEVGSSLHASM